MMNKISLISVASFSPDSLLAPNAWVGHLPFAAWIIRDVAPKIFVELGTHTGNSYLSFCQSVVENQLSTQCYAVDTWQGDEHAEFYDDTVFFMLNEYNKNRYSSFSQLLRMRFDEAVNKFSDGSVDLLHIDGLHTYEAARHDFYTWLPKLSPGAVVMFHDTNVHERSFGVWKLWAELQMTYKNNINFLHSNGLGVFQLNDSAPDGILEWLRLGVSEKQIFMDYFASLGQRQMERFELNKLKQHAANPVLAIVERDAHIVHLEQVAAALEVKLAQQVGERNAHIHHLETALDERNGQLARANMLSEFSEARTIDLTKALSEAEAQVCRLQQVDSAFRESTCWRITRPLRILGHQLLRVRIVINALPYALEVSGGYRGLARLALKKYQEDGFSGIKRSILFSFAQRVTPAVFGNPQYDYREWVSRYDTLTKHDKIKMETRIREIPNSITISILMPVYNPPLKMLQDAINSVQSQIYTNWELCIADDASTDPAVHQFLRCFMDKDPRIKVVFRAENGHISAATNSALSIASGDYVALLDQDDLLSENALFWVALAIVDNIEPQLIYSDEDKIDESGCRYDPYFKSDWNPDLFLSHNIVCHLGVYRLDLVKKLGGFREGYEGAQDYDLALRCTEQIDPRQIIHIPRVLYHWRSHAGSTAQAGSEKAYALINGRRALDDHFARIQVAAKAELLEFGMYRACYTIPALAPLVSLIIPTRNGLDLITQCIDSIITKTSYQNYEIIVVDNNSDDPSVLDYFNKISSDRRIRVLRDERHFNYSELNNTAVEHALGEYVCLVNNDIEVISPDWLQEMISLAMQPGVGAVGARLWYPNDTLQHGGVIVGLGGVAGHSHKRLPKGEPGFFYRAQLIQTMTAVTAACLVINKNIYKEVGGFDEKNLKVAFNDVDFCLKVREAGYRNVWTPLAELYHHESATRGNEDTPTKQLRFREEVLYMKKRWGTCLRNDPAYSPNLTLEREDFSYACPPRVEII